MSLIVTYILTILALFSPFEPLKLAGTFIIFCFLPGLCLFFFGKEKISLRDVVLATLSSIGISSILILGSLSLGVHIKNTYYIIIAITGILVLFYIILRNKRGLYITIGLTRQELLFCSVAFIMTVLLSLPIILGGDGMDISAHSFFHSSITTQILNGIFPPENPGLGGVNTSYFWGGNAFVAAISSQLNLHPLKINSMLNFLSLFILFCIVYCTAETLDFPEAYRYLMPLAVIGLMRSDEVILFAAKLLSGNLLSLKEIQNLALGPGSVMSSWIGSEKLPFFDMRLRFVDKFYNAGFMSLSLCLTFAYFLILLILTKNKAEVKNKKVYMVNIGVLIITSVFIYLPLAIIPLLHAPIWAGFIFLSNKGNLKERFRKASEILLPYLIAILLVLPYILHIRNAESATSSSPTSEFQLIGLAPTVKYVMVFWLPFPVIVAGIWIALKRLTFSKTLYFLLIGTFLFFGLSVFMQWGGGNEYKFAFILSFFFAILFVFALSSFLPKIRTLWLKGFVTASIILFLLSTPFLVEASYFLSSHFQDTTYTFSNKHILFSKDTSRNEAYAWIRENTPPQALVMLTYIKTPSWDCPASNNIYRPAAILERNLFVIMDLDYVMRYPEYTKRVSIRTQFFEDPENPQVSNFFASLNRPVYLLVEGNFNQLPENSGEEFSLMFQNDRQKVYLIHGKF